MVKGISPFGGLKSKLGGLGGGIGLPRLGRSALTPFQAMQPGGSGIPSLGQTLSQMFPEVANDLVSKAQAQDKPSIPQLKPPGAEAVQNTTQAVKTTPKRGRVKPFDPGASSDQRALWAKSYLQEKHGLSDAAAAGIVGNLWVESGGFKDSVLSGKRRGDGGTAWYAAQWRFDRKANLEKFAGGAPTFAQQLDFVIEEMNPNSPYADRTSARNRNSILNAKDPRAAALAFRKYYERAGVPHDSKRQAIAQKFSGQTTTLQDGGIVPPNPLDPLETFGPPQYPPGIGGIDETLFTQQDPPLGGPGTLREGGHLNSLLESGAFQNEQFAEQQQQRLGGGGAPAVSSGEGGEQQVGGGTYPHPLDNSVWANIGGQIAQSGDTSALRKLGSGATLSVLAELGRLGGPFVSGLNATPRR